MVAGGKPLWYLEVFTTVSTLFLTLFFMAVCLSWSTGLGKLINDSESLLSEFPQDRRKKLLDDCSAFREFLLGGTFYSNVLLGLIVSILGGVFGYLMLRERVKVLHSQIWLATVSVYTLVWMVTSIVFFVELEELARTLKKHVEHIPSPLNSIYKWGEENTSSTVIGLVITPTILFLFLSFVAYRLYVKIEIFGNQNPERIATENTPGSWFERQGGAEGGTWERESHKIDDDRPLVKAQEDSAEVNREDIDGDITKEGHLTRSLRADSVSNGWGAWLEDVFDYTF